MMKMAVVEIIGVTVVGHRCMAAAWSMGMGVIFNNMTGGFHGGILGCEKCWDQVSSPPLAFNRGNSGHPEGTIHYAALVPSNRSSRELLKITKNAPDS